MGGLERRRPTLPTTVHSTKSGGNTSGAAAASSSQQDVSDDDESSPISSAPWDNDSSPGRGANNKALHHRHGRRRPCHADATTATQLAYGVDNESSYLRSGGGNTTSSSSTGRSRNPFQERLLNAAQQRMHHHNHPDSATNGSNRKKVWRKWVRACVLGGIPAYLLLIYLFLKRLGQQQQDISINGYGGTGGNGGDYYYSGGGSNSGNGNSFINSESIINNKGIPTAEDLINLRAAHALHTKVHTALNSVRLLQDKTEAVDKESTERTLTQQASERQKRTRPPMKVPSSDSLPIAPLYKSVIESDRPLSLYEPAEDGVEDEQIRYTRPSSLEEICGSSIQDTINHNSNANTNFLYRDSFTTAKSRPTRVLITGILSQPGYLLALALKQKCNVQIIIGFDAMYPNAVRNRLRMQEQMGVLSAFLPKLVKPLFAAYAGLDPLKHSKSFKTLPHTNEMDLIQTLSPTHVVHLANFDPAVHRYSTDPNYRNLASPYVREIKSAAVQYYDPSLRAVRTGLSGMEQILHSIAEADPQDRPHFVYASASTPSTGRMSVHTWSRRMDEVMADYYYHVHGVFSVGLRMPNTIYGQWIHPESSLHSIFQNAANFSSTSVDIVDPSNELDILHVDDVVDAVVGSMQYRSDDQTPVIFDLKTEISMSATQIQTSTKQIIDPSVSKVVFDYSDDSTIGGSHHHSLQQSIGWEPRVSVKEGLVRTMAWYLDRENPYGPPLYQYNNSNIPKSPPETGDMLLKRHSVPTCSADDIACFGSRPMLPCASECSVNDQCVPTIFDELVPMMQELTEECDIVLLTQNFDKDAEDLNLQSEFMEDGKPLVCNFAFVASESKLIKTVIEKVPTSELGTLGLDISPEDENDPDRMLDLKYDKLNGRLLYRGWILVWTKDTPDDLATNEKFFLKLSPGRLLHQDVTGMVFIDQGFGVPPKADDIQFLVSQLHRKPWPSRVLKRKAPPKAKFLLPPEPQRRAVVLMSELKYQDSSNTERMSPDEKVSTYEATRFMRFSNGEPEPLGKEPQDIKHQREFYDRLRTIINPDYARNPSEPVHKFELKHWVRSRWVAHDMAHEESRQLRCDWYQEHVSWGTELDQLSFAYVVEKMEVDRKLEYTEPDDSLQKHFAEQSEMKKLLSDTFEWFGLKKEQNQAYSNYEEMQILPHDMDYTAERELTNVVQSDEAEGPGTPMYVRVISDRVMAYARKNWNSAKKKDKKKSTTDNAEL